MKRRQREPDYLLRRPSGDDYPLYLDDVTEMWKQIEDCQETISDNLAIFQGWLEMFPAFADKWKRFQSAGGVSSTDWKKFCEGTMRHKSTVVVEDGHPVSGAASKAGVKSLSKATEK